MKFVSGRGLSNAYTTGDYPEQLTHASDGSAYVRVAAMDAWSHAPWVYEGGSTESIAVVILVNSYDRATGLELSTEVGRANTAESKDTMRVAT